MKKLIVVSAILFAVASAMAGSPRVVYPDGRVLTIWPEYLYRADGTVETVKPTAEQCADAGVARWETPQEQAAREAIEAAQAAENQSNAALYSDPQPAVFLPRFSGNLTNIVGLSHALVDAETGEIVAVDETGSPEHTAAQKQAQRDAQKAAWNNGKAGVKGQLQKRIENIEAYLGWR